MIKRDQTYLGYSWLFFLQFILLAALCLFHLFLLPISQSWSRIFSLGELLLQDPNSSRGPGAQRRSTSVGATTLKAVRCQRQWVPCWPCFNLRILRNVGITTIWRSRWSINLTCFGALFVLFVYVCVIYVTYVVFRHSFPQSYILQGGLNNSHDKADSVQ